MTAIERPSFDVPDYDWLLEQERAMRRWFLIERGKMDYADRVTAAQIEASSGEYVRKPRPYKKRKRKSR